MRPDRIIVGEIRGGEALDMLQAMNTATTARSPRARQLAADALSRVETMVLMSGMDYPSAHTEQICAPAAHRASERLGDGTRRITQITEVQGMEGDIITLQNLFVFDWEAGMDENGFYRGRLKSTGIRRASSTLRNHGSISPTRCSPSRPTTPPPPESGVWNRKKKDVHVEPMANHCALPPDPVILAWRWAWPWERRCSCRKPGPVRAGESEPTVSLSGVDLTGIPGVARGADKRMVAAEGSSRRGVRSAGGRHPVAIWPSREREGRPLPSSTVLLLDESGSMEGTAITEAWRPPPATSRPCVR